MVAGGPRPPRCTHVPVDQAEGGFGTAVDAKEHQGTSCHPGSAFRSSHSSGTTSRPAVPGRGPAAVGAGSGRAIRGVTGHGCASVRSPRCSRCGDRVSSTASSSYRSTTGCRRSSVPRLASPPRRSTRSCEVPTLRSRAPAKCRPAKRCLCEIATSRSANPAKCRPFEAPIRRGSPGRGPLGGGAAAQGSRARSGLRCWSPSGSPSARRDGRSNRRRGSTGGTATASGLPTPADGDRPRRMSPVPGEGIPSPGTGPVVRSRDGLTGSARARSPPSPPRRERRRPAPPRGPALPRGPPRRRSGRCAGAWSGRRR